MPIIYREEEDSFELKDPTEQEKEAIFNIAIDKITKAFGTQVAQEIVDAATKYHESQKAYKTEGGSVKIFNAPTLN